MCLIGVKPGGKKPSKRDMATSLIDLGYGLVEVKVFKFIGRNYCAGRHLLMHYIIRYDSFNFSRNVLLKMVKANLHCFIKKFCQNKENEDGGILVTHSLKALDILI